MDEKKVLLVFEKPSTHKKVIDNKVLQQYLTNKNYDVVYSMMITDYIFQYPTIESYKNYPIVGNFPEFMLMDKSKIGTGSRRLNHDKFYSKVFLESFDELILLPDPDHTGVWAIYLIFEQLLGSNWKENFDKIHNCALWDYSGPNIDYTFNKVLFRGRGILSIFC